MSLTITNNQPKSVALKDTVYQDELLTFTGAATVLAGTILARLTATLKMVPFVIGGAGGAEVPLMVTNFDIVATGAGDISTRLLISGQVRQEGLIVDADGTGANITRVHIDSLRDVGILAIPVKELNILDNQ